MKKSEVIFLQIITVLFGLGVLVFMLWEPHIEGRNVNATLFEIYFKDPFLACAYIASIAFFIGLYQVYKLLAHIGDNNLFTLDSVKALRTIKYCAKSLVTFVLAGEAYLFMVRPEDDIAGGVFMGLLMIAVFGTVAIVAGRFERILQNVVINNK